MNKLQFDVPLERQTMQNAKCKVQNECIAKGDGLKNIFLSKYRNYALCIMNYAFYKHTVKLYVV